MRTAFADVAVVRTNRYRSPPLEPLPQDWLALCLLIFVLGLKHGFDADHLATIDGLTRYNQRHNPGLARFCGVFFSLGHGGVVIVIALVASTLARQWEVPLWLGAFGAWTTILFLTALGWVNIRAVLAADPAAIHRPVGLKGRFLGHLTQAATPGLVALVGALFAISFDTISQTALFAVTASQEGGWQHALALGCLFMLGMLATDGANGFWISRLILRADQIARVASRVMSLVIGGLSLLVAAFALVRLALPAVEAWSAGREWMFGAAVVVIIAASFLAALHLTRNAPAQVCNDGGNP